MDPKDKNSKQTRRCGNFLVAVEMQSFESFRSNTNFIFEPWLTNFKIKVIK